MVRTPGRAVPAVGGQIIRPRLPIGHPDATMDAMDTRLLRAFLTVVETGGISAAAEKLGYAQSSVSDQLRGLERDLGVPVLHRTSVGTVPTEAGARLLPYAR